MKLSAGALILIPGLLCPALALAQADAIETVTVTAPKYHFGVTPGEIAHDFVRTFATPAPLRDGISRWHTQICPQVEGLPPQYAAVIETHFRTIAAQAGAPLKDKGCRGNLLIYFTPKPQETLDQIHAKNTDALGYHGTSTVSYPIQAWYVTGISDIRGQVLLDQDVLGTIEYTNGGTTLSSGAGLRNVTPLMAVGIPNANIQGWKSRPDVYSEVLYATVIIDSGKIGPYTVAQVADYVAMLALSRTQDYEDCQLMPSITNLLSPNCDDKLRPDTITPTDIAYLRGIYRMDSGATLQIQRDQIAGEVAAALAGGK